MQQKQKAQAKQLKLDSKDSQLNLHKVHTLLTKEVQTRSTKGAHPQVVQNGTAFSSRLAATQHSSGDASWQMRQLVPHEGQQRRNH